MRRFHALSSLLAAVTFASGAETVQAQDPPMAEVSANRFFPAPGRGNFLMVESADVRGNMAPTAGLFLDYAYRPFVLFNATCAADDTTNCTVNDPRKELVAHLATATVLGSLTLADRVQIGLAVPIVYSSGESFGFTPPSGTPVALPGGDGAGVGDVRLSAKVRIMGDDPDGLHFGVTVWGTAPLGQLTAEHRYVGDHGPTFGGHLIGDFAQRGFHVAGNVGGMWRDPQTLFSTNVGPQLTYGVALGYDITPLVTVLAEVTGASTFTTEVDENPLEARLAGRIAVNDFSFQLGGGVGLVSGVGVPVFRVLGSMMWAPERGDRDGDHVQDRDDACPTESEDLDDYQDDDGCPDLDNDSDGIPDSADRCPVEAEDHSGGPNDHDGCPNPDRDNDGIRNGYDSCPDQPEDMDGDRDDDGCPDNDRDRDGINDDVDHCPDEAEDTDGYGDEDGCPEVDFDNDTVPDDTDQCPDQAEDRDGFEDEDGCPEEGGPPAPGDTTGRRRRGH